MLGKITHSVTFLRGEKKVPFCIKPEDHIIKDKLWVRKFIFFYI